MAPYLENSVLLNTGEYFKAAGSPPGCPSQASPTPGSVPQADSPPATGLSSPVLPSFSPVAVTTSPVPNAAPVLQTQVVDTVNYVPAGPQHGVYPPQQMIMTAGHPMMTQTYPTVPQISYVYVQPAPSQGEYYSVPQYEVQPQAQPLQYVQPLCNSSHTSPVYASPVTPAPQSKNETLSYSVPQYEVHPEAQPVQYVQPLCNSSHTSPVYVTCQHATTASSVTPAPQSKNETVGYREGESISTQLEVVWHGTFRKLFDQFPNKWDLMPVTEMLPGAKTFMDSAKVRFICPNCQHCWTSMKGRVTFGYSLDNLQKEGLVVFRLYGQKCLKCQSPEWIHSMWYEEEVKKVIHNIHQQVAMTFYNSPLPKLRIERRRGRPSKPHDLSSCQACEEGVCREEKNYC